MFPRTTPPVYKFYRSLVFRGTRQFEDSYHKGHPAALLGAGSSHEGNLTGRGQRGGR
jgi:hypothetical protein